MDKQIIEQLRAEYGEAFYLLDSAQFRKNFAELKTAFNNIYPNWNIAYSYKTNYTPKLSKIVNELGGYAEVVSEMELEIAKRVGCKMDRVIWNGPIKNVPIMEQFLLDGGTINIDCIEELEQVKDIHNRHADKLIHVGIRCNYDVNDGVVSRFGFDIDGAEFMKAVKFATTTKNVKFINFQCHFAKRQIAYWPARAKGMVDLIDRLGIIPERIDIGGGLFGKMADSLKAQFSCEIPDYEAYAKAAAPVFADYFKDKDVKPELLIEPGSAVVGDCMKFVGTVKTIPLSIYLTHILKCLFLVECALILYYNRVSRTLDSFKDKRVGQLIKINFICCFPVTIKFNQTIRKTTIFNILSYGIFICQFCPLTSICSERQIQNLLIHVNRRVQSNRPVKTHQITCSNY
jgi:diaminopimelate decarboxylase